MASERDDLLKAVRIGTVQAIRNTIHKLRPSDSVIAEAIVAARDKPDANAPHDAKGRLIELRDFDATEVVGVQIGTLGHKLWICIDGIAVLRVNSPKIELEDMREPKECPPEGLRSRELSWQVGKARR